MYKKYIKRILDLFVSLILLIISSPILCVLIILIKLESEGPAFFSQERIGFNCEKFRVYKLRTMITETHRNNVELKDKDRLTKCGNYLRKLSLDELPQLFKIIKGDMSFIGPRPLLVRYLPYYTTEENRRHSVKPGITGLAQINGRSHAQWEDRFKWDLYYVDKLSFVLDLKILIESVLKVIKGSNTSSEKPKFLMDFDKYRKMQKNNEG